MTEHRVDPLTGHEVMVAPGRRGLGAGRPGGLPEPLQRCPFCPGHEADTEATILARGEPWQVRVVANRFPLTETPHEVLVEHRAHDRDLADFDAEHATLVLSALAERVRVLEGAPGVRAVLPFRNRGRRAGSSQPHPHCQIVALERVPPRLVRLAERARAVDVAALIAGESSRHVTREGPWTAFCPWASERSFHVRIAGPNARLSSLDEAGLRALASVLTRSVRFALTVSGATDYNVLFVSPPVGAPGPSFVDVLPRTGGDAGFELESGMTVCTVDPDVAAEAMRDSVPVR